MVMLPCRVPEPGFAATLKSTLPFPCPEAGETKVIQLASAAAFQAHSCCVVTVTVPVPPLASNEDIEFASET